MAKNRKNDSSSFDGLFGNLPPKITTESVVQPVTKTIDNVKPTTRKKRGRPVSKNI